MTRGDAELALQWFEERASRVPMPGARIMYRLAAEALREQVEREKNEPLTLEELREMDGEQVYIQRFLFREECGWRVVNWADDWRVCFTNETFLFFSDWGKSWQAYRRKPAEGGGQGGTD